MFCVACTEPVAPPKVALSFKCDDETFAELVERNGVIPAPYMAQHKWVAPEQFDTLGAAELEKLIVRAYEIVKAKLGPSTRAKTAKKRPSRSLRAGKAKKATAAKTKPEKKPAKRKRKTVALARQESPRVVQRERQPGAVAESLRRIAQRVRRGIAEQARHHRRAIVRVEVRRDHGRV